VFARSYDDPDKEHSYSQPNDALHVVRRNSEEKTTIPYPNIHVTLPASRDWIKGTSVSKKLSHVRQQMSSYLRPFFCSLLI